MRRGLSLLALTALAGCGGGGSANEARNMSPAEVAAQQAQVRINPGEWELSTEITAVEAPELPREMMQAMQGRRTSIRNCITPEQASNPAVFTRGAQQQNSACQVRDFAMRDGRLQGLTVCAAGSAQEVRSEMSGRYGPSDFNYQSRVAMPAPIAGGTMNLTVRVQGRRVGDCAAQTENEG